MSSHFEFDPRSGFYRIRFRYGGRRFNRSKELKIRDEKRAIALCGLVDETIRDLNRGVIQIPNGVDPGDFITSGGKLTAPPPTVLPAPTELTLGAMLEA